MALNQERLAGPSAIANTASSSTLPAEGSYTYQVPSSTVTIVKQIMLTNITGERRNITIWLKPSATAYASITSANAIYFDFIVSPFTTEILNLSLVMDENDRLYARASAASSVNITISGLEES